MALIGTSASAHGAGGAGTVVTASKTSTSGSLVVGGAGTWNGSVAQNPAVASSLAGTYTEAGDKIVNNGAERIEYGLTYNIGGTRGAAHTLTVTPNGVNRSVSWQEFDSIDSGGSPTVGTEATNAGSSAPSCSVTVPSGTATVVGIMVYVGASTTAAVTDGTQITEADEASADQAHFIAAKFGVSGTVTITWSLAASRAWACYAVAFPETGGGGGSTSGGPCFDGRTFRGLTFGRVLGFPQSKEARMWAEAKRLDARNQQLRRAA